MLKNKEDLLNWHPLQKEASAPFASLLAEHLWDTPKALLISFLQETLNTNVLIITGKKEGKFLDALPFFGKKALDFLPWETLLSEDIAPSLDITGSRLHTLYTLGTSKKKHIIHCSIASLIQKTIPKKSLLHLCALIKVGEELSLEVLTQKLISLGYIRSPVASDKGEFALRGGLVDIFPVSATHPFRIDFFGDTVESIRSYDPVSQRSITKVSDLFLSPALEHVQLKEEKKPGTLLDYLGENTLIILDDPLSIENTYLELRMQMEGQKKFFFPLEELLEILQARRHFFFLNHAAEELSAEESVHKPGREYYSRKSPFQTLSFSFFTHTFTTKRWNHPFVSVSDFFSRFPNIESIGSAEMFLRLDELKDSFNHIEFVVENEAEKRVILEKAEGLLPEKSLFSTGYLPSGFVIEESKVAIIPAAEITKRQKIRREQWRTSYHMPASEFHELTPGDTVVHVHSGIGTFLGVVTNPNHQGEATEYLSIAYAHNSKLFVPVSQSHLVSRYIGLHEEKQPLSELGSTKWQKACVKAHTSIVGYAKELLEKAAQRELAKGFAYPKDSEEMAFFEEAFPFEETEDQKRAIAAVKEDMQQEKAMDRLICGDVGYGKTEVALRAAFKAVCDGKKQVAVLVPTTILALQHYETFKERLAGFSIEVAVLSRFSTAKQTRETLQKVKTGKVSILIGTHRLLSKDISFSDLGLLIIDEEQKFGVKAKEHIRGLKAGVDCITLSATPIPRTLYLSLIGARDISEINTPPGDRLPIKTIIAEKEEQLIKNGALRELSRGGQVFFIHNRIETLPNLYEELSRLLPAARIVMGHGQMSSDEIDSVFHSFKSGMADVLLSTTIVESGIDIPNANTIFVDRADQFGMADLYQLRGRVGRWNRPSYAYFLTPPRRILPEITKKRLSALVENSGYGGGMKLALRDLEIRGAGDILGTEQSGQVSTIGFHLYSRLLKRAINALKQKKPIELLETKMEIQLSAKLPESYINEPSLRMELYYRLGHAESIEEIEEILLEIVDRFGPMPKETSLLGLFSKIKLVASHLQITSLKFEKFTFTAEKQVNGKNIKKLFTSPSIKEEKTFFETVKTLLQEWSP